MTIEEMKSALFQFCGGRDCKDCPCVADEDGSCYASACDGVIVANYKRVFGKEPDPCNGENDVVNHPAHYTQGGIECIDAMKAAFGAEELAIYCKIAAFKYIWRCEHKNGTEDVKKAVWYLNKYLELKEGGNDDEKPD